MKKLSKIFLALALVLVFVVPFVFAGCEFGATKDVNIGDLYYCTPSIVGSSSSSENDYNYVKFDSYSQISFAVKNVSPSNLTDEDFTNTYAVSKSKENGHIVYTAVINGGSQNGSNGSIKITVNNNNTITVAITVNSNNANASDTRTGQFIKYVG